MIKHLTLLLFFGLAWGQEGFDELIIKKAGKNIKFKIGQKLIVNTTIEGIFKEINSDHLVISNKYSFDERVLITAIKRISIPSKISLNISFKEGFLVGAGIVIIPITMLSIGNPEAHYGLVFASIATPIMAVLGGLTSYILPKGRRTKLYLIQENEWKIVK